MGGEARLSSRVSVTSAMALVRRYVGRSVSFQRWYSLGWCLCALVGFAGTAPATAHACMNEEFRTGRSAGLPDCRAYELVTPANLGRTQDLAFTHDEATLVTSNGDTLVLRSFVPFGPSPSVVGARVIFSRTPTAWQLKSVVPPEASEHEIEMELFSPDLSQVAFRSETALNAITRSPNIAFEAGPVGGPYALVASVPREEAEEVTQLAGGSADFGHVLLDSTDRALSLSSATEEAAAKQTDSGAENLYEWSGGHLRLVNIRQNGSLINPCGARLGAPSTGGTGSNETVNAVSQDGSTVFFTAPAAFHASSSEPGCNEPERLYMRVNGGEPVEVSAPEPGVKLGPSGIQSVRYNYATPDGSKVFFNTNTPLTADDTSKANKLFEYDAEEPEGERLRRIATGVPEQDGEGIGQSEFKGFFFSEDGGVVYEFLSPDNVHQDVYRDDTSNSERGLIAELFRPGVSGARSYVTPNGEFLLIDARLEEGKHEELFRYDHADGSVICVTCGAGVVPATEGQVLSGLEGEKAIFTEDDQPAVAQISEDGQEVFFQTTARLTPQDRNSTNVEGLDVYEWEANGTGGCSLPLGCTYLISAGETSGPSYFLGMSSDGSNVFFSSATQLVPNATPEFTNIYDARVGGGFVPERRLSPCLSCQGIGSPPPLFSPGASLAFAGAGNQHGPSVKEQGKSKVKHKKSKSSTHHSKKRRGKSKAAKRLGGGSRGASKGAR